MPNTRYAEDINVGGELPEFRQTVTATTVVLGAMASRDWRPMHHDKQFAIERSGVDDIFLNSPSQAAWFERYLSDWGGADTRLGKIAFKMRRPIKPGDEMVFRGAVNSMESSPSKIFSWVDMTLTISIAGYVATECAVRVAIPFRGKASPWCCNVTEWASGNTL